MWLGSCYVENTFETVALLFELTLKLNAGLLSVLPTQSEEGCLNNIKCYSAYPNTIGKFTNSTKLI